VHWDLLKNFQAPPGSPAPESLIDSKKRPWIDHAYDWIGAMIHPSNNMPDYGGKMGNIIAQVSLRLHTDMPQAQKQELATYLIQYGIDLTAIADNGGGWHANGGHGLGRKWPILFAGLMLDNTHMKDAGKWPRDIATGVEFQEDQQHFYISQKDVDLSNSPQWNPDARNRRSGSITAYTKDDIGTPDWCIRYAYQPTTMNGHWLAKYRQINAGVTPGLALAAHIMGARDLWNHEAFFDYQDRYIENIDDSNVVSPFVLEMWQQHRSDYPPVWSKQP
jgi:hypothetical protein